MSKKTFTRNENYKPYTYLIGWSKINKYYYGVRYSRKANPSNFWKDYFTSSEYVKEYREKYGEPDIIQVRKVFDDANSALQWERNVLTRLLKRSNINRNNWLNVCIGQNEFSISDECIKKISNARKSYIRNRSEEQKNRDYESRVKAASSKESREKISAKAKERFADPSYRKYFEDNVWNNKNIRKKLSQNTTKWLSDENNKAEWLKTVQSDEYREKQSKGSKERYCDDEYREKWLKSIHESRDADPNYNKKKSDAAIKSTGNRLAARIINKLTIEELKEHTEESLIKMIKENIDDKYEFDNMRIIKKLKDAK